MEGFIGDHTVVVRFADVEVNGSPFFCRIYDARKIQVGDIPNGLVGKSVHFVGMKLSFLPCV